MFEHAVAGVGATNSNRPQSHRKATVDPKCTPGFRAQPTPTTSRALASGLITSIYYRDPHCTPLVFYDSSVLNSSYSISPDPSLSILLMSS